jgi:hypothetical protein
VVASGYRRARAAREAGLPSIPCRTAAEDAVDGPALFLRNLEDNLSVRSLNLLERAMAVRRITREFQSASTEWKRRLFRRLGLAGEAREVDRHVALDRLSDPVKTFILDRNLPDSIAFCFTELERNECDKVAARAERLRLTASQVRELITWGREIAGRDGVNLQDLLGTLDSQTRPVKPEKNVRQRDAFFDALKKRRFPDFSRVMNALETDLKPIQGVAGMQVTPPAYLEGDTFTVRFRFRSAGALEAGARALLQYAKSPELARALARLQE